MVKSMSSTQQLYTPEQYLERERKAEFKSEYRNGEIVPMPSANRWRSRIITNLISLFSTQLHDGPEEVLALAMRVKIAAEGFCVYTYPDVLVTGKYADFEDEKQQDVLLNPIVIVDVFATHDPVGQVGLRKRDYRHLASLKEYIGVFMDRPDVCHWQRLPKREWLLQSKEGLDKTISLQTIACELPLSEIYRGVASPHDME